MPASTSHISSPKHIPTLPISLSVQPQEDTPATPSDLQVHTSVLEDVQEKDTAQDIVDALIAGLNLKPPAQVSSPVASSQEGLSSRINKTCERMKSLQRTSTSTLPDFPCLV
ncbi:hypothetical protein U1Q18_010008, partial [Sarracenia purpurea var. burkii]